VLILQHPDSFEWENPWKPKNAATAYGFHLLAFLKLGLAHTEDVARRQGGLEVADGGLGAQ
jgi:hypothetical protein